MTMNGMLLRLSTLRVGRLVWAKCPTLTPVPVGRMYTTIRTKFSRERDASIESQSLTVPVLLQEYSWVRVFHELAGEAIKSTYATTGATTGRPIITDHVHEAHRIGDTVSNMNVYFGKFVGEGSLVKSHVDAALVEKVAEISKNRAAAIDKIQQLLTVVNGILAATRHGMGDSDDFFRNLKVVISSDFVQAPASFIKENNIEHTSIDDIPAVGPETTATTANLKGHFDIVMMDTAAPPQVETATPPQEEKSAQEKLGDFLSDLKFTNAIGKQNQVPQDLEQVLKGDVYDAYEYTSYDSGDVEERKSLTDRTWNTRHEYTEFELYDLALFRSLSFGCPQKLCLRIGTKVKLTRALSTFKYGTDGVVVGFENHMVGTDLGKAGGRHVIPVPLVKFEVESVGQRPSVWIVMETIFPRVFRKSKWLNVLQRQNVQRIQLPLRVAEDGADQEYSARAAWRRNILMRDGPAPRTSQDVHSNSDAQPNSDTQLNLDTQPQATVPPSDNAQDRQKWFWPAQKPTQSSRKGAEDRPRTRASRRRMVDEHHE
ncbi:hypothetical protein BDZ91DRAFT_423218 [Kalaharituber pfeilii]|nr:hypothetical protein BDZ91DRAFT_423218 [Kalaharituber pfeilii]